ncbi:DNA repair protein XRCC4-like [Eucyclogobius newberryi]|uniref:DNA repair protein XRCC4-like n=1 Tax=Eucyclogobius newberryi TaxID=166745 RepID=UPI003B5B1022
MRSAVHQIFITSDPNIPYFLRVDWSGDLSAGFTLILTNGSAAWIGEVSEEEVTKCAKDTGISREEYVQELHKTLIQDKKERGPGEKSTYSFQFSSDQLTYQKMSDNVLVKLGSVELQPAPDSLELNQEMISQSLKRNLDLEATNSQLLEENCKLQQEHRHILKELNLHVKNKNNLEKQMYSRFVLILNDKKSKIRELQENVRALQRTSDQPKAKVRRQRASSGDDDDNNSLDTSHFQDPTLLITGRNLVCHGIPVSQSFSSEASSQPDPQY